VLTRAVLAAVIFVLASLAVTPVQSPPVSQIPEGETPGDPVALLQKRIDRGEVHLRYAAGRGYLQSVLKELAVPVSSQSLAFSKTSLQSDRISPATPRAIYFNDDVYVAWIPDAPMIELASTDPRYGTMFYTLAQSEAKAPAFQRLELPCTSCHGPANDAVPSPILLMLSAKTDDAGNTLGDFDLTTDRSPINERWGGWYVTGTHGNTPHMGRTIPSNTSRYLAPHSDIIALMLLAHQADVHNRINETAQKMRVSSGALTLSEAAEPLLKALLFSGAAPLAAPIRGSSNFAKEFTAMGSRDRRGRSLREFDLQQRLFRYPLSYLIYSEAFRQLPIAAKEYVYRRLKEVLTNRDRSEDFAHLSESDRKATLEILTATMPEFQRWFAAH